MADRTSTHVVELGPAVVVKRFRSWSQDEHRREWRALTLLAEHAPGLAPDPVRAEDGALDARALLSCFELTAAESARLVECRRLLALFWFLSLLAEDPARPRNPRGTAVRQAGRLLTLLDG